MIIKVYIQFTNTKEEYDLNKDDPLEKHLHFLTNKHSVTEPSNYTLQVESTKHYLFEDQDLINVTGGSTLVLKLKPNIAAASALQALQDSNMNIKKKAIFELRALLKDELFAREFLSSNGLGSICSLIGEVTGNTLAYALAALQEAMIYGFGWESLPPNFASKVVSFVESSNLNVCKSALEILILLSGNEKYGYHALERAFKELNPQKPYHNIINLSSLGLINNLIQHAPDTNSFLSFIRTLDSLQLNNHLKKNLSTSDIDFKRELYFYQRHRLSELQILKNEMYKKENPEHEELLKRLWKATFPETILEARVSEQWKLIGFQGTDPATDFRGMGLLGLKNLLYFAEEHQEVFRKIVTEQAERKERDYPVAVAGINITQMLFDLFKINQPVDPHGGQIFNVLFDKPNAFEEVYCIALQVLNSTWDEMMASYMDFPRVIAAVKKQMIDILATNPTTLDQFVRAATWSGPKQQSSPTVEEEETAEPEPIKQLRQEIKQELLETVKLQKLIFLLKGANFKIFKIKGKPPVNCFIKLSENKQELLSGNSESDLQPLGTQTFSRIKILSVNISESSDVLVGVNSPLFSKQKKLTPQEEEIAPLTFSIILKDPNKTIDIVALNREDFVNWTDGLRALLHDKVENPESLEELKVLVNLELRVRLLDLEGIEIPHEQPSIPPFPDNLNFVSAI